MRQCTILVLCDTPSNTANTIFDHIGSFEIYSKHKYFYYNPVGKNKPVWLCLDMFDAIIIHYSIYVLGDWYLNNSWREAISSSRSIIIQFIQDEYRTVNAMIRAISNLNVNIVYTLVENESVPLVYPSYMLPGVTFINTLPGYVPDNLINNDRDGNRNNRKVDVGYRGRKLGFWYGEVSQSKYEIATRFSEIARKYGLCYDISAEEKDRIYGSSWIIFLKNCRCFLGTESGASVIDFSGNIELNVKQYITDHPKAGFKEVQELFFKDVDGKINMCPFPPRLFEAVACGACLVLLEGRYCDMILPDTHYISIKSDYSNAEEVVNKIRDEELVRQIWERSYQELIASEKYSYRKFVDDFDCTLEKYIAEHAKDQKALPAPDIPLATKTIMALSFIIGISVYHFLHTASLKLIRHSIIFSKKILGLFQPDVFGWKLRRRNLFIHAGFLGFWATFELKKKRGRTDIAE
jgi:hypothetical protein